MKHTVTEKTERLLTRLDDLCREVERWLDLASAAAREEWQKLRSQLPAPHDPWHHFALLSDDELQTIGAKAERFRDLLKSKATQPIHLSGASPRTSEAALDPPANTRRPTPPSHPQAEESAQMVSPAI